MLKLGIDIGVLRQPLADGRFSRRASAYVGLKQLGSVQFKDHTYLAIPAAERDQIMRWLDASDFASLGGLPLERVYLYRDRGHKLAQARELGLTHVVDVRPEVLELLPDSVAHRFYFEPDLNIKWTFRAPVTRVVNWVELTGVITGRQLTSFSTKA
jgi:hypothetical protein